MRAVSSPEREGSRRVQLLGRMLASGREGKPPGATGRDPRRGGRGSRQVLLGRILARGARESRAVLLGRIIPGSKGMQREEDADRVPPWGRSTPWREETPLGALLP